MWIAAETFEPFIEEEVPAAPALAVVELKRSKCWSPLFAAFLLLLLLVLRILGLVVYKMPATPPREFRLLPTINMFEAAALVLDYFCFCFCWWCSSSTFTSSKKDDADFSRGNDDDEKCFIFFEAKEVCDEQRDEEHNRSSSS